MSEQHPQEKSLSNSSRPADRGHRQIVHIIGSGHSGSTLLDMILGGHDSISSLGEVYSLHFLLRDFSPRCVCTCGQHVTTCPFWRQVEVKAQEVFPTAPLPALSSLMLSHPKARELFAIRHDICPHATSSEHHHHYQSLRLRQRKLLRSRANMAALIVGVPRLQAFMSYLSRDVALYRRVARDTVVLYDLVRLAHDTPIIVDSSKNPGSFKNIYLHADEPIRFILLLRDGRAICRSRMRREHITMQQAARIWKAEHFKRRMAQLTIPRSNTIMLRYEDLTRDPEAVLRRICTWLGISYEPVMLDFRADRHNLGGNPMRFRSNERKITPDEAWKQDLSPTDLASFERIAGSLNRRLGY